MKKILLTATLMTSVIANADDQKLSVDVDKLYLGGSISQNIIDSPFGGSNLDATGFGFFAGYELDNDIEQVMTSLELGYSQTGDFIANNDVKGIWLSGVAQKQLPEIDPRLSAIARLGLDLGDDDGIFMGAGAAFQLIPKVEVRAEYINKDATTVYQLSGVFKF